MRETLRMHSLIALKLRLLDPEPAEQVERVSVKLNYMKDEALVGFLGPSEPRL